jgi:hypothetical protein
MLAQRYSVRGSRRLLAFCSTSALVGIALSVTETPGGPIITVASLLLLLVGLHRFGRTGPDGAGPGPRRPRRRARAQ